MKNTIGAILSLAILVFAVLGCGADSSSGESGKSNQPSNRPPSNSAPSDMANVNTATTTTTAGKTGVRECDELVDSLATYSENPEDNFAVRAGKNFVVERIKESVKQTIEDNKNNLGEMTKRCQDIKREFDRSMSNSQNRQ
jgi:hypothetical protein